MPGLTYGGQQVGFPGQHLHGECAADGLPLQAHPLIRKRSRALPQPPDVPRQQRLQKGNTGTWFHGVIEHALLQGSCSSAHAAARSRSRLAYSDSNACLGQEPLFFRVLLTLAIESALVCQSCGPLLQLPCTLQRQHPRAKASGRCSAHPRGLYCITFFLQWPPPARFASKVWRTTPTHKTVFMSEGNAMCLAISFDFSGVFLTPSSARRSEAIIGQMEMDIMRHRGRSEECFHRPQRQASDSQRWGFENLEAFASGSLMTL